MNNEQTSPTGFAVCEIEPVKAAIVTLQPGDATRYVFLVTGNKVVHTPHGRTYIFSIADVDEFIDHAPEVWMSSYDNYHAAVRDNEICQRMFAEYGDLKLNGNPWTRVAALVARIRCRS